MIKTKTDTIIMRLFGKGKVCLIGAFLFVDFYRIRAVIG